MGYTFKTVEQALQFAVDLIEGSPQSIDDIKKTRIPITLKHYPKPVKMMRYTLTNHDGETGHVGLEQYRAGYVVWMLYESGFGVRI